MNRKFMLIICILIALTFLPVSVQALEFPQEKVLFSAEAVSTSNAETIEVPAEKNTDDSLVKESLSTENDLDKTSVLGENFDLSTLNIYVAANKTAGLEGDVFIQMSGDNGIIYLPGLAACGDLTLSWNSNESVTIIDGNNTYKSGKAPLPAAGESHTYTFSNGSETRNVTLKTVQGSESVAGMFLAIDEDYCTIKAMNSDLTHETKCRGSVSFKGKTYVMDIKGRGNWTWAQDGTRLNDKKPYNMTIYKNDTYDKKKKTEFIDGVESKTWSLLANYADGTLMHNKVAYDLSGKLGIGIESRYVDIWMNGEYIGNYLMTPKNDCMTSDDGFSLELDNNFDTKDPYFALEGLVATGTSENVFTVKKVGDNAEEAGLSTEDIKEWMQKMLNSVMDFDSDTYKQYIDVDSWAKFYLVYEYCKSIDMLCGSMLMHRDGLTENDKLIAGPIWDMDVAFGHVFNSGKFGISSTMQVSADGWIIDSINGSTSFLQYLGMHKDFMKRVYEIFNEYKDAFAESVEEINTLQNDLQASANMNYTRWSVTQTQYNATYVWNSTTRGGGKYAYNIKATRSWQDYISNFNAYLSARFVFFSDNLTATKPEGNIVGDTSYIVGETVSLKSELSSGKAKMFRWQTSANGQDWSDIEGENSESFSTVALQNMNGTYYRCIVTDGTGVIQTQRVARVELLNETIMEPVMISTTMENHKHAYTAIVTSPTCSEGGYTTYFCCCGDSYVDDYTKPTGHNYGKPIFTWNGFECTASASCSCGDNIHPQCTVTNDVTVAATRFATGVRTYTATVTIDSKTYTSTKTETIPRVGNTGSNNIFSIIINFIMSIFSSIFKWR